MLVFPPEISEVPSTNDEDLRTEINIGIGMGFHCMLNADSVPGVCDHGNTMITTDLRDYVPTQNVLPATQA